MISNKYYTAPCIFIAGMDCSGICADSNVSLEIVGEKFNGENDVYVW